MGKTKCNFSIGHARGTATFTCCVSVVGYILMAADAYRILAYEPSAAFSHWNVMSAVLESLLDAGHEVVCATPHLATDRLAGHPNYTRLDVSAVSGDPEWWARDLDYSRLKSLFASTGFMIGVATERARRMCERLSAYVCDALDRGDRRRFHAVVMESLFSECQRSLFSGCFEFSAAVYVVPSPPVHWMPVSTGSPDHPSYMGTLLAGHPTPGTFVRRLRNSVDYAYANTVRRYWDSAGGCRHRGDNGHPHRRQSTNTMVFVNTHCSVEPARPLGPNILQIGGIHLRRPIKSLPRDLADKMNNSNQSGVIVFTLGSLVAMNSLPEKVLDAFKLVFNKLPQTIIWKYENDYNMIDKPINVFLRKWIPQREVLQHQNVKLFISHGGLNGLYESIDAQVPVLGIPLFYDQPRNIQNLVDLGMALSLDINSVTETKILSAINRLLIDPSFSANAKRVSLLFRDRPMSPADSVVYWTEYMIRHGKSTNFRPLSADASWISHFMIDICVVLTGTIFTLYFCIRIFVYKILGKIIRLLAT